MQQNLWDYVLTIEDRFMTRLYIYFIFEMFYKRFPSRFQLYLDGSAHPLKRLIYNI